MTTRENANKRVSRAAKAAIAFTLSVAPLAPAQTTRPDPPAADALMSVNLPENTPLKVLIDYYSQEFGVNVLYDEQVGSQRLTIQAPAKIPRSAFPSLLDSALKMRGFALVNADRPGWKQVVPLAQAARVPVPGGPATQPADAVTQVFKLQFSDAVKLDTLVKPFLTQPGGSSFPLPEQGLLVVTDYGSNMGRVSDLVRAVDQPSQEVSMVFLPVRHADPARLTQQVDQLLKAKLRAQGGQGGADRLAGSIETGYDARTNTIVVIAPKDRLADAREVVRELDTVVAEDQSPIHFYPLANTTAADVLATIRGLQGEDESETGPRTGATTPVGAAGAPAGNAAGGIRGGGTSPGSPANVFANVTPPGGNPTGTSAAAGASAPAVGGSTVSPRRPGSVGALVAGQSEASPQVRDAIRTKQARVTADPHTNSIIVAGPPDVQRLYEQLIRSLDKRRPQVLIECTIVTLDTTNNVSFGVEIGKDGGAGNNQLITFSSFGLSTPNPQTGRLTLIPGVGFNGALISSDIADVIVQALKQDSHARVTSAPRILVNDNNLGTLSSLQEFPYASVNASNTVATTSFGDYAQAGTEITVTPHISESDYLQLEYSVSLSSFTGNPVTQGGTTLPPPRKSDTVQSEVTIPDGATIIVGGLNQRNYTYTKQAVPILGEIPGLEYLFSQRSKMDEITTLFVFMRPVILRDDRFADLKFLSEEDVRKAGATTDLPASEPLTMR